MNSEVQEARRLIDQLPEKVEQRLQEYDRKLRDLVEEHPVATVLGAAAVGYLLARLFSRH